MSQPATAPTDEPAATTAVRRRLPWPLPPLLAWALGWLVWAALGHLGWPAPAALAAAAGAAALVALGVRGPWRRLIVVGGFPLSVLLLGGAAALPGWVWLLPLALLLGLYPIRAWRDAPVFPTDAAALAGLDAMVRLPPGARILDAGSGLGHGLRALQRVWPTARIEGLERSGPLAWWSRRRCPFARVTRADMWAASWQGADLVYLFQRPESMPRAWAKACAEMVPGAWLASLEFAIPGVRAAAVLQNPGHRPVLLYRIGAELAEGRAPVPAQSGGAAADKPRRPRSPRAAA